VNEEIADEAGAPVWAVELARAAATAAAGEAGVHHNLNLANFVDDEAAVSDITKQLLGGDWMQQVGASVSGVNGQAAGTLLDVFFGARF